MTREINLTCQYPAIMGVVHYNMSYKLVTCTESAFCATRRFIMPTLVQYLVKYLDMGVWGCYMGVEVSVEIAHIAYYGGMGGLTSPLVSSTKNKMLKFSCRTLPQRYNMGQVR